MICTKSAGFREAPPIRPPSRRRKVRFLWNALPGIPYCTPLLLLSPRDPFHWARAGAPDTMWAAGLLLIGGVDDLHEVSGLQGGSADQAAVHIGLSQQLRRVTRIHGATVLDQRLIRCFGTVQAG